MICFPCCPGQTHHTQKNGSLQKKKEKKACVIQNTIVWSKSEQDSKVTEKSQNLREYTETLQQKAQNVLDSWGYKCSEQSMVACLVSAVQ